MYRGVLVASVAAVTLAVACLPQREADTECRDDGTDCPIFPRNATKVECECTCDIATSLTESRTFSGAVETCLPPRLNVVTASGDQRVAMEGMSDAIYSRNVYDVCRDSVAHFIQTVVRGQLSSGSTPVCLSRPVDCRCAPNKAWADPMCRNPCPEIECNKTSCAPLLREHDVLYPDACVCTRARSCGTVVPAEDEAALCRVSP